MKRNNWMVWLTIATMMILLSACGGGGGGGGDDNTTASGNQWDTMKWDQGQWN